MNITEQEIQKLRSARSEEEWDSICDEIVRSHAGYPSDWYMEVIASGLRKEVAARWGGTDKLTTVTR